LLLGYSLVACAVSSRANDVAAGGATAFFALFKLTPGVLLPWFLLRGRTRAAIAFVVGCAVLSLLSLVVVSPKFYLEFFPQLGRMGYGRSTWENLGQTFWRDPYNQSFNALFHRIGVAREGSGVTPWFDFGPKVANALTWLVTLALGAGFAIAARSRNVRAERASLACAICFSLLAPALMWDHYLVQLLAPAALLWWNGTGYGEKAGIGIAMLAAALPLPLDHDFFRSGPALILGSTKLLPPLILFALSVRQSLSTTESAG